VTLRDERCYKELAEQVREIAQGRAIVEIVNSGNWGDALIHAGQRAFFDQHGIRVKRIFPPRLGSKREILHQIISVFRSKNAIICGGGGIQKIYNRPQQFSIAARNYNHVIIMPSSYPFLPDFDQNRTQFWRRDHLESEAVVPNSLFCHDMAFFLAPSPRFATKELGILFRTDLEKPDAQLSSENIDISNMGTHTSDPEGFFDAVGEYEIIHTDRLHVAVAGALLGREVHIYASKTPKQEAVFHASMAPFYEKVYFHADLPAEGFGEARP
jgi:exopolysaccharide biosynthesis predicted pyruvyltransferase EpsI